MEFHVLPYTDEWETEWDRFVMKESGNGTFLHTRRFLNYHPKKKFTDASFLILNEKKAIAAVCRRRRCSDGSKCFARIREAHTAALSCALPTGVPSLWSTSSARRTNTSRRILDGAN